MHRRAGNVGPRGGDEVIISPYFALQRSLELFLVTIE